MVDNIIIYRTTFDFMFLHILIIYPLIAIIMITLVPKKQLEQVRLYSLIWTLVGLIPTTCIYFYNSVKTFFYIRKLSVCNMFTQIEDNFFPCSHLRYWMRELKFDDSNPIPEFGIMIHSNPFSLFPFNMNYNITLDFLSIWFVISTALLFPIVILISWESIKIYQKWYYISSSLLYFALINLFVVDEILLFYIFFEAMLIPMILLIGIRGSSKRRIYAAMKFLIYTLLGSVLMFTMILWLYEKIGSTNIYLLNRYNFSLLQQFLMFIAFFSAFAVKIPTTPLHLWLPEAHVEAPTGIPVLSAGILSKTGGYGYSRFVPLPCKDIISVVQPFIFMLSIISILYASVIALRQTDLKKTIAYASIAHMNLTVIGIFTSDINGISGAIYSMPVHGIVSSGLSIRVGILYDRYHTRIIKYYSGMSQVMPLFAISFFLLSLGNISFPFTGGFIGEFLIFYVIFKINSFVFLLSATGIILGAFHTFWLINRILYGSINDIYIMYFCDLNFREGVCSFRLICIMFVMGLFPNIIISSLYWSIVRII